MNIFPTFPSQPHGGAAGGIDLSHKAWVYPIIVAWTWGYGWLASMNSVGRKDDDIARFFDLMGSDGMIWNDMELATHDS